MARTIAQLSRILPLMRARLEKLLVGPNAGVKAATAIRVAVSHYIVRSDDRDQFLAQLQSALGPPRAAAAPDRRAPRAELARTG